MFELLDKKYIRDFLLSALEKPRKFQIWLNVGGEECSQIIHSFNNNLQDLLKENQKIFFDALLVFLKQNDDTALEDFFNKFPDIEKFLMQNIPSLKTAALTFIITLALYEAEKNVDIALANSKMQELNHNKARKPALKSAAVSFINAKELIEVLNTLPTDAPLDKTKILAIYHFLKTLLNLKRDNRIESLLEEYKTFLKKLGEKSTFSEDESLEDTDNDKTPEYVGPTLPDFSSAHQERYNNALESEIFEERKPKRKALPPESRDSNSNSNSNSNGNDIDASNTQTAAKRRC